MVQSAAREMDGRIDILVNNAGVLRPTPIVDITEEEWDHVIDVDLKGPFLTSQAAAPLLCDSGRGRIVNIGSDPMHPGSGFPISHITVRPRLES